MPTCASCGRPIDPAAPFCLACGAHVTPALPAPAAPSGSAGRVQEPWMVPVLAVVTLGVYMYVWAWRVTREVDAWRDARAHAPMRRAVVLGAIGSLAFVAAFVALFVVSPGLTVLPDGTLSEDPFARMPPDQGALVALGIVVGTVLMLIGMVLFYVGLWRVWRALEDAARARSASSLSPALMLLLVLVPYVNLVGTLYVLYRTQKELNGAWQGTDVPVIRAPTP